MWVPSVNPDFTTHRPRFDSVPVTAYARAHRRQAWERHSGSWLPAWQTYSQRQQQPPALRGSKPGPTFQTALMQVLQEKSNQD